MGSSKDNGREREQGRKQAGKKARTRASKQVKQARKQARKEKRHREAQQHTTEEHVGLRRRTTGQHRSRHTGEVLDGRGVLQEKLQKKGASKGCNTDSSDRMKTFGLAYAGPNFEPTGARVEFCFCFEYSADGATGVKALEESGPEAENLEAPEGGYVVGN